MRRWVVKMDRFIEKNLVFLTILMSWIVSIGLVYIYTFYLGMGYE